MLQYLEDDFYDKQNHCCQFWQDDNIRNSNKYTVLQDEDVFKQIEQEIESFQEISSLNFDNSLELFIHSNWNSKEIYNNLSSGNQDQIIEALKQTGEFNNHKMSIIEKGLCPICHQNVELVQFGCDHAFCNNCLKKYVRQFIEEEDQHYVRCLLDGCPYHLPYSFIITCTQKYNRVLCNQYLKSSKSLAYCTGANCNRIIRPLDPLQKEIQCECGNIFCFQCRQEAHNPAPCDLAKKWSDRTRNGKIIQNFNDLNVDTCPFCQTPIYKPVDYNYIVCDQPGGCQKSFCYNCDCLLDQDHIKNFECPFNGQKVKEKKLQISQESRKRLNFYYNGFINSENLQKMVQEIYAKLQLYSQFISDLFGFTLQDQKLWQDATQELIQSILLLKLAYSFGYNRWTESLPFDHDQRLLEFEELSVSIVISLGHLLEEIETQSEPENQNAIDISKLKQILSILQPTFQECTEQSSHMKVLVQKAIFSSDQC